MRPKPNTPKTPSEKIVRDIRRATRKHYSAEEKIRIVLDGLRGESSIAEICRREGIAESISRATFYRGYDQYQRGGPEALHDRSPQPERVWNRIPDTIREAIVDLALGSSGTVAP